MHILLNREFFFTAPDPENHIHNNPLRSGHFLAPRGPGEGCDFQPCPPPPHVIPYQNRNKTIINKYVNCT